MPLTQRDVPKVIEALVRRHRELAAEAAWLRRHLGPAGAPDRLVAVFQAFADAVAFHVQREEGFLFPAIRALVDDAHAATSLLGTMSTLELEHEELLRLEQPLLELAPHAGTLGPRLVAFLHAWESHHESEDALLFPAVRDLVDPTTAGARAARVPR